MGAAFPPPRPLASTDLIGFESLIDEPGFNATLDDPLAYASLEPWAAVMLFVSFLLVLVLMLVCKCLCQRLRREKTRQAAGGGGGGGGVGAAASAAVVVVAGIRSSGAGSCEQSVCSSAEVSRYEQAPPSYDEVVRSPPPSYDQIMTGKVPPVECHL